MTTLYEDYLKTLEEKDWHITRDLPMFEPGKRHDPVKFHDYEYLDFCDKLMGRPYGANGIGKLREVALVWPTEHEIHLTGRRLRNSFIQGGHDGELGSLTSTAWCASTRSTPGFWRKTAFRYIG